MRGLFRFCIMVQPTEPDSFAHLRVLLRSLPEKPGIYKHLDAQGIILYIGKAKNLKNRVTSYFRGKHENVRLQNMVMQVHTIEIMVTESEYEALLLENTLIKKEQPKYNISLKDGKSYPWIVIKKEPFPRVFPTFHFKPKDGEYFGPYVSGKGMYAVLDLIAQLYPLRSCSLALTPENIHAGKFKVCLEYHLKNCLGPCVGSQSERDYQSTIESIRHLLKGNLSQAKNRLAQQMDQHALHMEFEAAQACKDRLGLLEKYQAKSTVVNPKNLYEADVYSIVSDAEFAYINGLVLREGAVVRGHTLEWKKKLDESDRELLASGLAELRRLFDSTSKEIFVSIPLGMDIPGVHVFVPQRGDKMKLIALSLRNAQACRIEKLKNMSIVDPERHVLRLMKQMQSDLRLSEEPRHFECFDNSNFQGSYPVSACVVFKNGKPAKKEYRHFNVKTVEGANDFATMEEVITRRYSRMLAENHPLPQLILVDGGKGQLSSAVSALEKLGLRGQIAVIGIAKKLEELFYPNDPDPLYLDKRSETLKIVQRARDEAHRFGLTHHRNRRSKGAIVSVLEEIPGIGPASTDALLTTFHSVAGITAATLEELAKVVGQQKAKAVKNFLKK